ncbi:MAG TPA: RagB/SusD family nutrient uptake outer membrane protein [Gemmatimonadaceae bacterium]|nr:RagB/SusD family nutrient uptake outer membrane protein [Gemmatimonadaceae bacterium]
MYFRTSVRFMAAAVMGLTTITACRDMSVDNPNQPDVSKVFGTPRDVETIISKLFQQMYNGQLGSADDIFTQTITMSFESSSQLGNFGMGTRGAIPRSPIDNSIGNTVSAGNFRDFDFLSRNARGAANAIAALDKFAEGGQSTGSPARDARAKSFAYFTLGYALANLALFYDSAAILTAAVPSSDIPPLSPASDVMTVALQSLDSAINIANSAAATTGTGGFPIPIEWLSLTTAMSRDDFVRLVHSYKAKFRAGLGRSPTERAAADWDAIIADATAGITSDFVVQANAVTGWSAAVVSQLATSTGWSQMTPFILGMADTTGAYDAWLQQPVLSRTPFLLRTPDKRFPSGDDRATQTAVTGTSRNGPVAGSILYFRNRPSGEDTPADPWGTWYYDNWRNWGIRAAGGNGPYVMFPLVENDMLAAEGYIRKNNYAAAIPLINKSRTRAGLPALTVINSLTDQVPGGNACVPRVPQPPNFTTTACGNIFEAMKWEKRTETNMVGYAEWFIDSRGWGDLAEGTPLEWPVPYQELFARIKPSYTTSGRAAKGTYGF